MKEKADQNGRESTSTRRQSFCEKGATQPRGRQRLRGQRELTEKSTLLRRKTGRERDKRKGREVSRESLRQAETKAEATQREEK